MSLDDAAAIALVHRLAGADRRACSRVARLLVITEMEAQVVMALAGSGRATLETLQAELGLSRGGAIALAARLEAEALVRREPDPDRPLGDRLRLSPGAELELMAALVPATER